MKNLQDELVEIVDKIKLMKEERADIESLIHALEHRLFLIVEAILSQED